MGVLAEHCHPLSLDEALKLMDGGELPDMAVCVTFDDGYADNATVALPILKKWGIPATVFVASGFLNGGSMWNDTVIESIRSMAGKQLDLRELGLDRYDLSSLSLQRSAIQQLLKAIKHLPNSERARAVARIAEAGAADTAGLMMTEEQVISLASNGIEIGGHTVTHPILATLDEASASAEIRENKSALETLTRKPLRFFAYPNGRLGRDYSTRHCELVRQAGYSAALSTHAGVVSRESDRWQLARFTPWDKTPDRFLVRLMLNTRQLVLAPSPSAQ
jgi:peptidoglycan/xylan/chitin deacetylase (PgdA/CDA1 family)